MAIVINNAPVRPELEFNKVHLVSLSIKQDKRINDSDSPKYLVEIEYRLYGVDSNDNIEYEPRLRSVVLEDYLDEGVELYQNGDPSLLQAMAAIEQALATILRVKTEHGSTQVL